MIMRLHLSFFFLVLISAKLPAQGCSDAGFCTMGSIKANPLDSASDAKNKFSVLLTNGIGDQGVFVFTPGLQYDFTSGKHWDFQAKITANYASGNLGTVAGAGDLFLSSTYLLSQNKKIKNSLTIGVKLPLNQSDLKVNQEPLPMQYQSSLGTTDLVLGYSIRVGKFFVNAAWQQPLTGTNKNTYLPYYLNTEVAYAYAPSNQFNRRSDVLLRAGYQLVSKKKFKWNATALAIYHLGEDTYTDSNVQTDPIQIAGSSGLTLNITSMLSYRIGKKFGIALSGGAPLIVRKVRPDGLTRAFSLTPEINFSF